MFQQWLYSTLTLSGYSGTNAERRQCSEVIGLRRPQPLSSWSQFGDGRCHSRSKFLDRCQNIRPCSGSIELGDGQGPADAVSFKQLGDKTCSVLATSIKRQAEQLVDSSIVTPNALKRLSCLASGLEYEPGSRQCGLDTGTDEFHDGATVPDWLNICF